jgi:hypothetical protein
LLRMARRRPHRKTAIQEMANDTPAEEPGASEDRDCYCHRAYVITHSG